MTEQMSGGWNSRFQLTLPESDFTILTGRGEDRTRQVPRQTPYRRLVVIEFGDLLNLVLRDARRGV